MSAKPPVFVLRDILPWGALAATLTGAAVGCLLFGAGWGFDLVAVFGALLAGFGYGRVVYGRWRLSQAVSVTTLSGVYVLGAPQAALAEIEAEVSRTLTLWQKVVPGAADLVRGTYLRWEEYPFHLPFPPGDLAGHTDLDWQGVKGAFCVRVGYRQAVASTALGHELGHVILIKHRRDASEDTLAKLSALYGVPY